MSFSLGATSMLLKEECKMKEMKKVTVDRFEIHNNAIWLQLLNFFDNCLLDINITVPYYNMKKAMVPLIEFTYKVIDLRNGYMAYKGKNVFAIVKGIDSDNEEAIKEFKQKIKDNENIFDTGFETKEELVDEFLKVIELGIQNTVDEIRKTLNLDIEIQQRMLESSILKRYAEYLYEVSNKKEEK